MAFQGGTVMKLKCLTCNTVGTASEIACYNWRICQNFARAKVEGTLPNPFPTVLGGPVEGDRYE